MKDNFKFWGKVIVILLAGMITGGIIAMLMNKNILLSIGNNVNTFILENIVKIYLAWIAFYHLINNILFFKGKAEVERALANEEEIINDNILAINLSLVEAGYIIAAVFLFLSTNALDTNSVDESPLNNFSILLILFLITLLLYMYYQRRTIKFIKSYNPEKFGDILDMKFNKKWIETCDEREQFEIYKAGYKAYKSMVTTLLLLELVLVIVMVEVNIGIYYILLLLLIYLVGIIAYTRESLREFK